MNTTRIRPLATILLALGLVAAPGFWQGTAYADKLVLFKNGKVMRVKSALPDGKWLKCDFENGNYMSVPRREVDTIEEATLGGREGSFTANQVSEGVGTPYSPPPPGTRFDAAAQALGENQQGNEIVAASEEAREALAQETAERQAAQGARLPGRPYGGGLRMSGNAQLNAAGANGVAGVQNGGFQPLNQVRAPFAGRRGLTQRNNGLQTVDSQPQEN